MSGQTRCVSFGVCLICQKLDNYFSESVKCMQGHFRQSMGEGGWGQESCLKFRSTRPYSSLGVFVFRYKNDSEILAMTNLVAAYQRNEIFEFEKILKVSWIACPSS